MGSVISVDCSTDRPVPPKYLGSRNYILLPILGALLSFAISPQAQARHHAAKHAARPASHHAQQDTSRHKRARLPSADKTAAETAEDKIPPDIIRAVRTAERRVQADPLLLLAIAWQESRFNAKARNRYSSAQGFLQFTTRTWLCAIRDFGARHGLARYAQAIKTRPDGSVAVENPKLRRAILRLRTNPELQAVLAAEQLAQKRQDLEARLARPAGPVDLYVLHLLGSSGAAEFLTALAQKPEASARTTVGSVFEVNRGLFVRDGRMLSVAETYEGLSATLARQATLHAALFAPPG